MDCLNKLIFEENCGKRIGLVGGVEGYNFDDYLDIYFLMCGKNDKMKKYKNWKTYAQFSAFAKNVADVELLSKIKIVEKFGHRMPAIIDKVKTVCVKDTRQADIALFYPQSIKPKVLSLTLLFFSMTLPISEKCMDQVSSGLRMRRICCMLL